MSDLTFWIALSMLPDIGPVGSKKLLSEFRTPERIFSSRPNDLLAVEGIGINRAKSIAEFSSWKDIEKQIDTLEKKGIRAIILDDPSYPELLLEIEDSPVVIYMKGDIYPQDRYAIAIVGSRKPTHYGISVTEAIAEELAWQGASMHCHTKAH